ncbi:hypothetical protein Tco_1176595 [Tanacetum coccineum]
MAPKLRYLPSEEMRRVVLNRPQFDSMAEIMETISLVPRVAGYEKDSSWWNMVEYMEVNYHEEWRFGSCLPDSNSNIKSYYRRDIIRLAGCGYVEFFGASDFLFDTKY